MDIDRDREEQGLRVWGGERKKKARKAEQKRKIYREREEKQSERGIEDLISPEGGTENNRSDKQTTCFRQKIRQTLEKEDRQTQWLSDQHSDKLRCVTSVWIHLIVVSDFVWTFWRFEFGLRCDLMFSFWNSVFWALSLYISLYCCLFSFSLWSPFARSSLCSLSLSLSISLSLLSLSLYISPSAPCPSLFCLSPPSVLFLAFWISISISVYPSLSVHRSLCISPYLFFSLYLYIYILYI